MNAGKPIYFRPFAGISSPQLKIYKTDGGNALYELKFLRICDNKATNMFEPKVMEADGSDYVFPFHFGMIFRLHVIFQVVHSTETMSSINLSKS